MTWELQATPELRRIIAVPRRTYTDVERQACADSYTAWLRLPGGSVTLNPTQGTALHEIRSYGGLFGQILAGGGKTFIAFLAPVVCNEPNAILLTKSGLIDRTLEQGRKLAAHMRVGALRAVPYEALSRTSYYAERAPDGTPIEASGLLWRIAPRLIVCDEAQKLKNPDSATCKRLLAYLRAMRARGVRVKLVCMSGTITDDSILDYAHLVEFTTPVEWSWLPCERGELQEWHLAIDTGEIAAGAFSLLGSDGSIESTRNAYARRMAETPTVVITTEGETGSSLTLREVALGLTHGEHPAPVSRAFDTLRELWEAPDGWELEDAPQVWFHARAFALGFCYLIDPRPPQEWRDKRRAFAKCCRTILYTNQRQLDSVLDVSNSIDRGNEGPDAKRILDEWRAIAPSFIPQRRAHWLSTHVIEAVAKHIAKAPHTLIWTEQVEFGEALAKALHVPYFGEGGTDARGTYIENYRGHCVLSMTANLEGRDLQHNWHTNLSLAPSAKALRWEQKLARTHRQGQPNDEVTCDIVVSCAEHVTSLDKALSRAKYTEATMRQPQRICYADFTRDVTARYRNDPRSHWQKERPE